MMLCLFASYGMYFKCGCAVLNMSLHTVQCKQGYGLGYGKSKVTTNTY